MSRLLLDTHAFVWFVFGDDRLSELAARAIADPAIEKMLSVGSLWEIATKMSIGKLELGMSLENFLTSQVETRDLTIINVTNAHLVRLATLPFHHRDPFDRLIVAQAMNMGVPIVTGDAQFSPYGVPITW
jgi:PIN domain nuclease of toxin-antitoxin system